MPFCFVAESLVSPNTTPMWTTWVAARGRGSWVALGVSRSSATCSRPSRTILNVNQDSKLHLHARGGIATVLSGIEWCRADGFFVGQPWSSASPWVPSIEKPMGFFPLALWQTKSEFTHIFLGKIIFTNEHYLWFLKCKWNQEKFLRHVKALIFTSGVLTDVFYVVEQNVATS